MTLGMVRDRRIDLESYTVNALRSMVRARSDQWRDLRSRGDLMAELRQRLLDGSSIRRAIDDCDEGALEALWVLRERGGVVSVAAMRGQIATWHPERPPDQIHRIPNGLVRRALAFWRSTVPRYGSSSLHDISGAATDSPHSTEIFSVAEILAGLPRGIGPPSFFLTPTSALAPTLPSPFPTRQVLTVLRAVEERVPRVLRSGVIASRDRRAMALALDFDSSEQHLEDDRGRHALDDGGALVDFLRSVLEGAGLLRVTEDRHLQTTGASVDFVTLPPSEQIRTLLDAWLRTGENVLASLAHLDYQPKSSPSSVPTDDRSRAAYRCIVDALREHTHYGSWYEVTELSRLLRHQDVEFLVPWLGTSWQPWQVAFERDGLSPPIYSGITLQDSRGRSRWLVMGPDWDLVEGAFVRQVVTGPLTWLGVVDSQVSGNGRDLFTLTRQGARAIGVDSVEEPLDLQEADANAGALIVQPNFDIVVYQPSVRPELLYQIDRFAERVTVDRLAVFRLSRESFCGGLQLGITPDSAIDLLQRASRAEIPQNVRVSLHDWARQFDSVRWTRNACFLEAADAAALDRWMAIPDFRVAVDRQLSPTVVLVDAANVERLGELLSGLKVDVRRVDANTPLKGHAYGRDGTDIDVDLADQNIYLRAHLEKIAEPLTDNSHRHFYRLSRRTIEAGMAGGLTAEQILAELEAILGGHLPPGFRVRVKGWAGSYPPARLGTVAVISSPDGQMLRELRADPDLARAFFATISGNSALVRVQDLATLRVALADRGIEISEDASDPLDNFPVEN